MKIATFLPFSVTDVFSAGIRDCNYKGQHDYAAICKSSGDGFEYSKTGVVTLLFDRQSIHARVLDSLFHSDIPSGNISICRSSMPPSLHNSLLRQNAFSMNIKGILPPSVGPTETLAHYIESVIGLTLFTSWAVIALQKDSSFYPSDSTVLRRTLWPFYYVYDVISRIRARQKSANRRSAHGASVSPASEEEQKQSHLDITHA